MDLSYILLWTVVSASGVGLVAMLIRHGLQFPGWLGVYAVNAIAGAALAAVVPEHAGFIAFAIWVPTVIVPTFGARYASRLIAMQRFTQARRLVQVVAALHPFDGWRGQPDLVLALSLLHAGETRRARELFEQTKGQDTWLGRMALLHLHRLDGRWAEIRRWFEDHPKNAELERDIAVMSFYMRALGELEDTGALCRAYAKVAKRTGDAANLPTLQLFAATFTGRVDLLDQLFAGALRHFPEELKAFWTATSQQAAGDNEGARLRLEALTEARSPLVKAFAEIRLRSPLAAVDREALGEEEKEALSTMGREIQAGRRAAEAPRRPPVAMIAFLLINTVVFLFEIPGGTTDSENLKSLGALLIEPGRSVMDEWWRVATACFLHYGPVHLTMNLLGLAILGRRLEHAIGPARFSVVYLVAGVGSSVVYLVGALLRGGEPVLLVGASGSIMGVVGAITAVLLRRWRADRTRASLAQLLPLGVMLIAQTVFDIMTPKVAMLVHLSGALIGFLVGWALGERRPTGDAIEER